MPDPDPDYNEESADKDEELLVTDEEIAYVEERLKELEQPGHTCTAWSVLKKQLGY
jgi:hypothetical protein